MYWITLQRTCYATAKYWKFIYWCDGWGILQSISKHERPDSQASVKMEAICAWEEFWCGVKVESLIKESNGKKKKQKKTTLISKKWEQVAQRLAT